MEENSLVILTLEGKKQAEYCFTFSASELKFHFIEELGYIENTNRTQI